MVSQVLWRFNDSFASKFSIIAYDFLTINSSLNFLIYSCVGGQFRKRFRYLINAQKTKIRYSLHLERKGDYGATHSTQDQDANSLGSYTNDDDLSSGTIPADSHELSETGSRLSSLHD